MVALTKEVNISDKKRLESLEEAIGTRGEQFVLNLDPVTVSYIPKPVPNLKI